MELRPGYKQTEVGPIPLDWQTHAVHEFAVIQTGPFGTLLKASEYSAGDGVPVISVGEIRDGFLRITPHTPRVSAIVTRRLPQYVLRKGDIVFGRKGGVERSALIRHSQEGWFLGSDGISVRPSQRCHDEYLALQFQGARVKTWLLQNAIGTTMPSLNQEILRCVVVPLPPTKAEQEAIAEALSDADALIESLEQLLAKKRHLKQGAMQELLTGKRRLPGFSGEWEAADFGDIAVIRNAKVSASSTAAGTQCVELESIGQGTGRLLGSVAAQGPSSKYSFKKGDVLFGRLRAYLRKYWLATFDGICSTEIWPLIPRDDRLLVGFLHLLVHTSEFVDAAGVSYGTHMPRSDWSVLRKFPVQLPSRPEQIAIAAILADMDTELAALESKLTKARQIKQGMMQELLTGRIRLV